MDSSNYTDLVNNASYIQISNAEWKSAFAGPYAAEYSELVVVCDGFQVTPPGSNATMQYQKVLDQHEFRRIFGVSFNLASEVSKTDWLTLRFGLQEPSLALHVAHALVAPARTRSRVQLSMHFMIVVISANILKLLIMLSVLLTDRSSYVVTLGDAVASFLSSPDPVTEGKCLMEDQSLNHDNKSPDQVGDNGVKDANSGPDSEMSITDGWHSRTLSYFALIRNEQARCFVFAYVTIPHHYTPLTHCSIASFVAVLIGFVATTSGKAWSWGTSSDGELSFGSDKLSATATLRNAFLANMPQLLLSFCYMNLNSFCTAMTGAQEWNNFSRVRKALRVSEPRGYQRTTYFLQLPYRWSLPLLVLSTFLHWLLSQTFFLVRIDVFLPGGILSPIESRSACGVSVSSFLLVFMLFMGLCITIRQLASRKIVIGLPQAASNSMIISAGCHPPSDEVDPHLKPVQWGVVEEKGLDVSEHCAISSRPVTAPEEGKTYY